MESCRFISHKGPYTMPQLCDIELNHLPQLTLCNKSLWQFSQMEGCGFISHKGPHTMPQLCDIELNHLPQLTAFLISLLTIFTNGRLWVHIPQGSTYYASTLFHWVKSLSPADWAYNKSYDKFHNWNVIGSSPRSVRILYRWARQLL